MKNVVAAALALTAASVGVAAHAEEFNGPFVAVEGGYNRDEVGSISTSVGRAHVSRGQDSAVAGVAVGYDYTIAPRVVIGAEADALFGISDSFSGVNASIDPKRTFDFTARAGYIVAPHTLVYARGGYANGRVEATLPVGNTTVSRTNDRDGWLVGGGVERYFTDNLSARVEYRYTDLSDGSGKFDRHQALVGVAYHF
jgi:outer membrane immunogenic protein